MFSALYFFDRTGLVSAVLPAAAAHELGHLAAIKCLGGHISALRLDAGGAVIERSGVTGMAGELLTAAAGPAAGGVYALVCSLLGRKLGSEFLLCTAGVSAVLTLVNLLPAFPLDGGEMLSALLSELMDPAGGETAAQAVSALFSAIVAATGAAALLKGYGAGLALLALWLTAAGLKRTLVF